MGAMQPLRDSYLQSPFWQMFRKRVVWLGALFFAEMFTYIVLRSYEGLLHEFAFMVVFMPVITATGGNSGSQAASMITRALALGEITDKDAFRIGFREFFSGASLGLSIGFLGVVVVLLFHRDRPTFALVLLTALVCVTICGSLIGSLMPLVFKRLGMDPAISSGPFVASVVDVAGIFIYCTIALVTLHTLGL
jgi:magnesium transporter